MRADLPAICGKVEMFLELIYRPNAAKGLIATLAVFDSIISQSLSP